MSDSNKKGDEGEHAAGSSAGRDQGLPSKASKDPEDWIAGDERMTGAQASSLRSLSEEAGEAFDETMTKAQASERIEELQRRTGRGVE